MKKENVMHDLETVSEMLNRLCIEYERTGYDRHSPLIALTSAYCNVTRAILIIGGKINNA